MPPAQERLHAAHVDAVKFEYRLIENEELVLLEGLPEIGLELEPLHPGGLHLGLEPDVTIPSPGLRLTEGDGCVAEEIVRLVPVICRDADTRRDRKRNVNEPFDSEGFLQGVQQPSASSSGPAESDSPSARIANSSRRAAQRCRSPAARSRGARPPPSTARLRPVVQGCR